jgi:hypothetical protein
VVSASNLKGTYAPVNVAPTRAPKTPAKTKKCRTQMEAFVDC